MDTLDKTSTILSPAMLWRSFNYTLPLKESKISEDVFDNVVYSHMYFYGRDTGEGRVRIYGVYAKPRTTGKKAPKAGLLIIPDIGKTVDISIVNVYVKQGYAVLMIDYCGDTGENENFTKYPDCVSYANLNSAGRSIDYCDKTAKETAWYEWVAVARYGISFLKNQYELEKIGVIGIKNGANVGWQVCGTDRRVDCFVALFGAGWRKFRGIHKFGGADVDGSDERLRYLAAVDAHAYAQYVECPVFYMTSTNSFEFDCDRAMDTVSRVPSSYPLAINIAPRYDGVLDLSCKRNVDIFLAKYLFGYKVAFPHTPKIALNCEDRSVTVGVEIDFNDQLRTKSVTAYLAEDGENPAFRDWVEMPALTTKEENKKAFFKKINGNSSFVTVFVVVEYRNGITVSSSMVTKKVPHINSRKLNLVYSSKDRLSSFSVANPEKNVVGGVFFNDPVPVEFVEGSNKISGICSKYGLICRKFNKRTVELDDRSLIVFDVNSKEYSVLKVILVAEEDGKAVDYTYQVAVSGGDVWQHVIIRCPDFKSGGRLSIKDYSLVSAIRFESESRCIFNNLLIV
ncbi:MAG: hypothetical protein ILP02_02925 [Clostridia bacterium]|nr:hypothetical protein [Clostridia bacterium]